MTNLGCLVWILFTWTFNSFKATSNLALCARGFVQAYSSDSWNTESKLTQARSWAPKNRQSASCFFRSIRTTLHGQNGWPVERSVTRMRGKSHVIKMVANGSKVSTHTLEPCPGQRVRFVTQFNKPWFWVQVKVTETIRANFNFGHFILGHFPKVQRILGQCMSGLIVYVTIMYDPFDVG